MYIKRDIYPLLKNSKALVQVLAGPRQCGKSTLFNALYQDEPADQFKELTFDELSLRQLANRDPKLFLEQFPPPLLLDEVQYVPNLFPEMKKRVDELKRDAVFSNAPLRSDVLFRLTGSNQILMDKTVKESLAGRAAYFYLNTLTVHEIIQALPETSVQTMLFRGGWPELYTLDQPDVSSYLNDYLRTYIEKDIVMSAGIQKTAQFLTVLRLCAARTGQLIDYSDIQKDSGVSGVTVKEWISALERFDVVYQLRPYFNNLNKRLIKSPKLYFLDTGLATRLQGWSEPTPLLMSAQIGGLFETLVVVEILKFVRNYGKSWEIFFWRNKQKEEVDVVLQTAPGKVNAFEIKYAIHGISEPIKLPASFQKEFGITQLAIITSGGEALKLSSDCTLIPITQLHDFLLQLG